MTEIGYFFLILSGVFLTLAMIIGLATLIFLFMKH